MALNVTPPQGSAAIQLAQRMPANLSCDDQSRHAEMKGWPAPFQQAVKRITGLDRPPPIDNSKMLGYRDCTDAVRDRLLRSIEHNALATRRALPKDTLLDPQLTRVAKDADRLADALFGAQGSSVTLESLRPRIDAFVRANLTLVGEGPTR
jgi:hypothetical protein